MQLARYLQVYIIGRRPRPPHAIDGVGLEYIDIDIVLIYIILSESFYYIHAPVPRRAHIYRYTIYKLC